MIFIIDRDDEIDFMCIECFCCAGRHHTFLNPIHSAVVFDAHTYDANIQLTTQKAHTKIKRELKKKKNKIGIKKHEKWIKTKIDGRRRAHSPAVPQSYSLL